MRSWPKEVQRCFPVAVFLDRDGTINRDTGYTHRPEQLDLELGAAEGLCMLSDLPVHLIVVSNQSGIALGKFTEADMLAFNAALRQRVEIAGGRLDAFYYCPHREAKHLRPGEQPCSCSKPEPGMLLEVAADFGIDLSSSYLVGDKRSDIEAGRRAGCTTVLVLTGKAGADESNLPSRPDFVAKDLQAAAQRITRHMTVLQEATGGL